MKRVFLLLMLVLFLNGCLFTRTIYVPDGTAVRLRKTMKDVPVWVRDKNNKLVPGKMDLPEGWYCLPLKSEGK